MTRAINMLLSSLASECRKSDLAICQTLSTALDAHAATRIALLPLSPTATQNSKNIIARACPKPVPTQTMPNLMRIIRQCAADLNWRKPGFGLVPDAVAAHMAVCEIIGPSGQISDDSIRAGLLFQDANILYPRHSHAAEEIYLPLSGQAAWQTDDDDWQIFAHGDVIHHLPFQPHAINSRTMPLLAFWGWAGDIGADSYRI